MPCVIGRRRFPVGFDKRRVAFYLSWLNYSQCISTKYSRPELFVGVCVVYVSVCVSVC